MRFRGLQPKLMNLPELQEELKYQAKRLYRLRKLEKLGKGDAEETARVSEREAELDLEVRNRLRSMAAIPS